LGATAAGNINTIIAELNSARGIPQFKPPGPAFDASKAKGKTLFYLAITMDVPIVQTLWSGVQEAAGVAGLKAVNFDGKGQTALYVQGMQQAIARKVDCILVESIPSETLKAPIAAAQKAGIKVVIINERNVAAGGPALKTVNGAVTFDYIGAARLEADWVLADSKGKNINCVTFEFPGYPAHTDMVNEIHSRFQQYSVGGFKLRNEGVLSADWATRLPTLTRSLMTSDPTINYMIPVVDAQSLYIVPTLHEIGKQHQVKISTFNGTPAVEQLLKNHDVVGADIGSGFVWEAWADVDQALRVLTGNPPAHNETPPLRLIDRTNINSINLSAPEQTWYHTQNAKNGYKKLWGLG
jgi:ribose transport system substrate-binding protein